MKHSRVFGATTSLALIATTSLALLACGSGDDDNSDAGPGGSGFISISEVTPDHGPLAGGNTVVIRGSGFLLAGATQNNALIDGILSERVNVLNDNTIELIVPSGTESGSVSVTLFNGNGSASLSDVYSYNPLPTITDVDPPDGDYLGGETVTLTGSGFQALEPGENSVFFGDAQATVVAVASDSSMTVTAPRGTPGTTVTPELSNDNGTSPPQENYSYTTQGLLTFGHSSGFDIVADPNTPSSGEVFHIDPLTGVVESLEITVNGQGESGASVCGGTAAQDNALFVKAQGNLFVKHDLQTGDSQRLDPLEGCAKIHALTSHQGQLFAVCRDNPGGEQFGRIDPAQGTFTRIGAFTANGSRLNLASDGTKMFVMQNGDIAEINPTTGVLGQTTDTGLFSIRGLAFSRGVLYGLSRDANGGKGGGGVSVLFSIDPVSGNAQVVGTIGRNLRGLTPLR